MNTIFLRSTITTALLFTASISVMADVSIQVVPYEGQPSKALKERLDAFTVKYVESHSLVASKYPYKNSESFKSYLPLYWHFGPDNAKYKEASTLYSLQVDNHSYLAAIIAFNPLLTAEPHCEPDDSGLPTAHCEWIAQRNLTCHLFLFDPQSLKEESVTPINIRRDPRPLPGQKMRSFWYYDAKHAGDPRQIEGWPRCQNILAIAPSKVDPTSLLFTFSYFDSAAPADPRNEPPEFKTTIQLRISEEQGKLKVIQDDRCLGNPNMISSIAAARKALAQCVRTN